MKSTKKTTSTSKPTIESVLDDAIDTLNLGLTHLRTEIGKIAAGKAKKTRHDPASRIAFLTGKVGAIVDSARKVEGARAKRLEKLTPAMVLEYLRSLDAAERAHILREAQHFDTKRSG